MIKKVLKEFDEIHCIRGAKFSKNMATRRYAELTPDFIWAEQ